FPEAPPWLAAQEGQLSHVVRITAVVSKNIFPSAVIATSGTGSPGTVNLVAAMPSLHVGLATIVALALYDFRGWSRVLSLVYCLSMSFAVIYLGEHYFVDVVAGAVLAIVTYRLVEWRLTGQPVIGGARAAGRPAVSLAID